jgi:hypothetical protein
MKYQVSCVNTIYKIIYLPLDKIVYVGQTWELLRNRFYKHLYEVRSNRRGNCVKLIRKIRKWGETNFKIEMIMMTHTQEVADYWETHYINHYDLIQNGCNIREGGSRGRQSIATRIKSSKSLRKFYAHHKSKRIGIPLTDEHRANVSKSSMGKAGTNTGKTFNEEWKKKLSKSQSGKAHKSRRRFSEKTEKEICRLYLEEEKSRYMLGIQFNCTRNLIADILDRNKIQTRKSNYTGHSKNIFTSEQEKEICELYTTKSRNAIAEKFGCKGATIKSVLIRNGVKL